MGWFDSEKDDKGQAVEPVRSAPVTPSPAPSSGRSDGSTLGERIHVDGTIVSEEGLKILGRVEGKIQARQELTVAKGARVLAVIQGRRVVIEGAVKGDIRASEVVLLGPTASLEGNISTPSLQIQEGAFFKGNVEMKQAEPVKAADKSSAKVADKSPAKAGDKDPAKAGDKTSDKAATKQAAQRGLPGTGAGAKADSSPSTDSAEAADAKAQGAASSASRSGS